MTAAALLALIDGLITLVESVVPTIQSYITSGNVTVAQQQALKDRMDVLRAKVAKLGPLVDDGMPS